MNYVVEPEVQPIAGSGLTQVKVFYEKIDFHYRKVKIMINSKVIKTTIYHFIGNDLIRLIFFTQFVLLICLPLPGMCDTPEFYLAPDQDPIFPEEEFVVSLRANDDILDMRKWQCTFAFEPSLVAVREITAGPVVEPAPFFYYSTKSDKSIKMLAINMEPSDIPSDGVLANLSCLAINPGIGVLTAVSCYYEDSQGNEIPVEVTVESVNVTGNRIFYGDIDADGQIDGSDLFFITQQLPDSTCGESDCNGDFDGDSRVDWQDVSIFASSYGAVDVE